MKPALSIVFFTVTSGAGCGLLFWLGLLVPLGLLPVVPEFAGGAALFGIVLTVTGLLSSLGHLGHPERAWRALSQWRSSWLSREGVAAVATLLPAVAYMVAMFAGATGAALVLGLLMAAGAVATVICTAMIYASLKPIREWTHPLVVPGYLVFAGFLGAAVLSALTGGARLPVVLAIAFGLAGFVLKRAYWAAIDRPSPVATIESATGLGFIGTVRPLEAPHTETNYLLREMGFRIARAHAAKLRKIALGLGFALPVLFLAGALLGGGAAIALSGPAAAFAICGMLAERWLMFAEATHTVTLYYGARAV